jgi:phosphate transport system protein
MADIRSTFHRELGDLRNDILRMGSQVDEELGMALDALDQLDSRLASQLPTYDQAVNQERYNLEDKCVWIIASQQPTARDLRIIVTVMSMNVDLERMGDQAKGIAKFVPHLAQHPQVARWPEIAAMGAIVRNMLQDVMRAYAEDDVALARAIAERDVRVDSLYAQLFSQVMIRMAEVQDPDQIEAHYDILRVARELERYGDLAVNLAERVVFLVTGVLDEH